MSTKSEDDVPFQVGARVSVTRKEMMLPERGVVRFIGELEFAEGIWIGIELDDEDGKVSGGPALKSCFFGSCNV
jgi:tubulin-specific chaperone B